MIVRNWMRAHPMVVDSDILLSEAKRILTENNLHGLPVVDNGRLRGLITRANCLRAAHFALRTQNTDELNYFSNRIKVKDMMVRNPATVDANDTMEHCLQLGQKLGVAQFPVMDQDQVVGIISANEVFSLAAHFLGAWEKRSGVIGRITDIVEAAGAEVQAIYPIGKPEDINPQEHHRKRVIVRFHCEDTKHVVKALEEAGFPVIESVQARH
jgi:acetoin utilization protein AcuB